jgi:pimeloyl-ACP methyl ester carboxylesterase
MPGYADPGFVTDALVTRYHDLMRAPGAREAMLARLEQTLLVDPAPVLARIQAPTLLLWGTSDGMIPFANAADYQRALPHNRLVALPGAGHLPHEEAAAASIVPLRQFLLETRDPAHAL